jgi:polyferredoxin
MAAVMVQQNHARSAASSLRWVKAIHTIVWAFFAASIFAIPVLAWAGECRQATLFIAFVLVEVLVLVVNGWRCPLTAVAARYTDDRRDNFDIYLPEWLARHNKVIFGLLYVLGIVLTLIRCLE